jgi:hypothetical protein
VNGRDVAFTAGFDQPVPIGGFLLVTPDDGVPLLVQVHERSLAVRNAGTVDLDGERLADVLDLGDPQGIVQRAEVGMTVRFVEGRGRVLGRLVDDVLAPATGDGFAEAEAALQRPFCGDAIGKACVDADLDEAFVACRGEHAQDLDAVLAEPARDLCLGQALDMVEPRDPRAQLLFGFVRHVRAFPSHVT